jgi:hypothetical protein
MKKLSNDVDAPAEVQTAHIPNTCLERYRCTSLLGGVVMVSGWKCSASISKMNFVLPSEFGPTHNVKFASFGRCLHYVYIKCVKFCVKRKPV